MSSSNALNLHLKMCKIVVEASADESTSWGDLYKILPQLRHALACTVCGSIIEDPIGPADQICQHHVCAGCKGGKKRLKPSCSYCKDYHAYVASHQLALIVKAFRSTCEYLRHTDIYQKLNSFSLNGSRSSLVELIQEGAGFESADTLKIDKNGETFAVHDVKSEEIDSEHSSNESVTYRGNIHIASSLNPPSQSLEKRMVLPVQQPHQLFFSDHTVFSQPLTSQISASSSPPISSAPPSYSFQERCEQDLKASSLMKPSADIPSQNANMVKHGYQKKEAYNVKLTQTLNVTKSRKRKSYRGCRCGNATPTPGKLTCCGQRCPCYVESRACVNCKCRGCRNSHRPGGKKAHQLLKSDNIKLQDINPPIAPSHASMSPILQQSPGQVTHLQQPTVVHTPSGPASLQRFHSHQLQVYQDLHHESTLSSRSPHANSSHQRAVNLPSSASFSSIDHVKIDSSLCPERIMVKEPVHHENRVIQVEPSCSSSAPIHMGSGHFSSGSVAIESGHHQGAVPSVHQVIHVPHQVFQAPVFINTVPVAAINSRVFMADSSQGSDSIQV